MSYFFIFVILDVIPCYSENILFFSPTINCSICLSSYRICICLVMQKCFCCIIFFVNFFFSLSLNFCNFFLVFLRLSCLFLSYFVLTTFKFFNCGTCFFVTMQYIAFVNAKCSNSQSLRKFYIFAQIKCCS